ncbi:hypothetical protein [Amycolatopsis rhizosphaerae]|uniref:hypothetical protein n=1 Tax=Amycolatopsis rhizosphaerae TaxID=2053003 RepID=UPI001C94C498|nr:hypothetical protein [Amycolatopsis rhizosphaerae]
MTYPPPPGHYPGMPQYAGGVNQTIQPRPSAGTAIAAGALAAMGSALALTFVIDTFGLAVGLGGTRFTWLGWTQAFAYLIEVLTLGPGAVVLFLRKPLGRWLVLTGSLVQIAQGIIALIILWSSGLSSAAMMSGNAGGIFLVLAIAIATAILAALPITGRWLASRNQLPAVPLPLLYAQQPPAYGQQQPGFPPQPPGYGQQPPGLS